LGKSLVALQTMNETLSEIEHSDPHPESLPKPMARTKSALYKKLSVLRLVHIRTRD